MDLCREHLIDNGIWLTQYPVPVDAGYLGLVTKLTHVETGQWQSGLMMMPLAKSDPQGYGSAMTYASRYSLSALLGIVTEEDDDGLGGMPAAKGSSRNRQVEQAKQATEKDNAFNVESEFEQDTRAGKAKSVNSNGSISQLTNVVHQALKTMPKLDGVEFYFKMSGCQIKSELIHFNTYLHGSKNIDYLYIKSFIFQYTFVLYSLSLSFA